MYNPFSLIISKLLGKKDTIPELTMEEMQSADPYIQELESVRIKETIHDDATSQRIKRKRQNVRRNSNNNS